MRALLSDVAGRLVLIVVALAVLVFGGSFDHFSLS
jgi:hypothetical protein